MSPQSILAAALIAGGIWLIFSWLLFVGVNQLGPAIPSSRKLRELYQLSDPERFRTLIPSDVFRHRRRRAKRDSVLLLLFLLTLGMPSLLPAVLPLAILIEVINLLLLAVWSIVVFFAIRIYRKRVVLVSLGSNSIDEDSGANSIHDLNRALRWFYLPLAVVAVIALLQSPDQTYDLFGAVLAGNLAVLGFCTPAESQLCTKGLLQPSSTMSWRSVVAYHWYAHRQGVVFVRDTGTLHFPLVILPVPEDKADEVERILAEYLPGKRGEDVDFSVEEEDPSEQTLTVSHS